MPASRFLLAAFSKPSSVILSLFSRKLFPTSSCTGFDILLVRLRNHQLKRRRVRMRGQERMHLQPTETRAAERGDALGPPVEVGAPSGVGKPLSPRGAAAACR